MKIAEALGAAEAAPVAAGHCIAGDGQRWPTEAAWAWYRKQPWLVGFNYIPATAINTTEMW